MRNGKFIDVRKGLLERLNLLLGGNNTISIPSNRVVYYGEGDEGDMITLVVKSADSFLLEPFAYVVRRTDGSVYIAQTIESSLDALKVQVKSIEKAFGINFEENELEKRRKWNVDIHFDYAMSVQVEAGSIEEARQIVEDALDRDMVNPANAEYTGDYELDTSYQPSLD